MDIGYPESLLVRMLEIYSPSGGEEKISKVLAEEMVRLGFDVNRDGVGNVLGQAGKGSPKVLLCGHMDTIEGALEVKKRGKVIFGRGAVDAKSPLAALICGAAKHIEGGGKGTIHVLAVVDEEGKSRGMKNFISNCKECYDYAIFGEPSGAYAVTVGYKGRLVLKATVKTAPGHASAPQLFENAVYVAMRLVGRLRLLEAVWAGDGKKDLFEVPTLCVTCFRGGAQDNTVPSECEVTVDVRVPPSQSLKEIKGKLIETVEDFSHGEKRAEIKVAFADENKPYLENSESKLVKVFIKSINEVSGREGRLLRKTGTGDVNDFVKKFKTSAVVYGPGNSKLDHTPLENVSLTEYLDSIKIVEAVLKQVSIEATKK
jgi:LysW-gamma-L-lysine carboxypeptidase